MYVTVCRVCVCICMYVCAYVCMCACSLYTIAEKKRNKNKCIAAVKKIFQFMKLAT